MEKNETVNSSFADGKQKSPRALSALNFFLADVQNGMGMGVLFWVLMPETLEKACEANAGLLGQAAGRAT